MAKLDYDSSKYSSASVDAFFARAIEDARRQNIPLPEGPIKTNGQYQSYKKNKTDKKKTMRLKAHADGVPNISIWDWSKGKEPIFTAKGSIPNGTDAARIAEEVKANSARREAEDAQRRATAATETERLLATLPLADPNHPYLKAKGIEPPDSIRQQGDDLFIPIMRNGKHVGGEIIGPDGSKRALVGTDKQGGSFLFGAIDEGGALYICEGFGTGATIHEAKGCPVLVTFGSGNLPPVALAAKAAFPDMDFTIASDDDWTKSDNPGRTKASEAALAIGARVAIPDFSGCDDRGAGDTDFNDLARLRGLDAVRECLDRAAYVETPDEADAVEDEDQDAAAEDEFADETASDDAETAARASALRAILIDGLGANDTEKRIKRQWPQLKDKIPAIIDSAQRTAENWKPGATRTIAGMRKRIMSLAQINERFVMVAVRGQPSCVAQIGDALFMARSDFVARLADSVIVTRVSNKCEVKTQPASAVWLGDCRRSVAKKIVFTSRPVGPECFNLWTGFGVTPKAGRCDLIFQHIRDVICAKNPVAYEAFLNLLAWQVQNIGRASRIIVVLYSEEQQIGKGMLLEKILTAIFGLHGMFSGSGDQVFGRFNEVLRGKAYAGMDESCFAGNRKVADTIKSYAATESLLIEGKGIPAVTCPIAVNWYMATNHAHAAHVEEEDARYWILKVSPCKKGDVEYWAKLHGEIDNGGPAALLHDLLARDVSNFVPQRDVPRDNEEHRANRRASDPANPAIWLLDCLDNGFWLGSEKWEGVYTGGGLAKLGKASASLKGGATLLPAFLESSYRMWASGQGRHAQPANNGELWKLLTAFGFEPKRAGGRRYRVVPDEEILRANLENRLGLGGPDLTAANEPKGDAWTAGTAGR